jgi:hypothetical protein
MLFFVIQQMLYTIKICQIGLRFQSQGNKYTTSRYLGHILIFNIILNLLFPNNIILFLKI